MKDDCPKCGRSIECGAPFQELLCPHCGASLKTMWADPAIHCRSEIDPHFKDAARGTQTPSLLTLDQTLCPKCGHIYPVEFSCCPELLKLALEIYFATASEKGPQTQQRVIECLRRHANVLTHHLRELESQDKNILSTAKWSGLLKDLGLSLML